MKKFKIDKRGAITIASCVGTVMVGVTTFIGTRKASKYLDDPELTRWEKTKKSLPYYIPSFITLGGTLASILFNHKLSYDTEKKLTAALVTAGELSKLSLEELEKKCTPEEYEEIIKMMEEELKKAKTNDVVYTWREPVSGETFEATKWEVTLAFLNTLEVYCFDGSASLNVLRQNLGLDWDPKYEDDGWDCASGIYNIPFDYDEKDGVLEISYIMPPEDLSKYQY